MTQPATDERAREPLVLRDDRDGVVHLVLNRPRSRNALSAALMGTLQSELDRIAHDPKVRVVVLGGAGPAFCSGHDLKEVRSRADRSCRALFSQCSRLMISITRLPQPVIARVHGVATAAGCQLVATCDLAVAARSAWFATPGVSIGLFCSTPAVALSRTVPRKHAMEMLLTGDRVDAERAVQIGLVNRVVEDAELDAEVESLAGQIAGRSSLVVKLGKEAFYRQLDMDLEGAYAHASEIMTRNLSSEDAREGIDAFLGKRAPRWQDR